MKFWSQLNDQSNASDKNPISKKTKVLIGLAVVVFITYLCLLVNPIAISISYDDSAYDSYDEQRKCGTSFYSTESGTFYTTHGIDPFDIEVHYLLAPSEDLREAFENGNITIEDLDRLGFDYWFKSRNN